MNVNPGIPPVVVLETCTSEDQYHYVTFGSGKRAQELQSLTLHSVIAAVRNFSWETEELYSRPAHKPWLEELREETYQAPGGLRWFSRVLYLVLSTQRVKCFTLKALPVKGVGTGTPSGLQ